MNFSEKQYSQMAKKGITSKQDIDQHDLILAIMLEGWKKEKKVWWFAYELMGFKEIGNQRYFMSYKASTRVCELAKDGKVESRKSEGKLHLYASVDIINIASWE